MVLGTFVWRRDHKGCWMNGDRPGLEPGTQLHGPGSDPDPEQYRSTGTNVNNIHLDSQMS